MKTETIEAPTATNIHDKKKAVKVSRTAFLGFLGFIKLNIVFLSSSLHSSYSFIPQGNKTKFKYINM